MSLWWWLLKGAGEIDIEKFTILEDTPTYTTDNTAETMEVEKCPKCDLGSISTKGGTCKCGYCGHLWMKPVSVKDIMKAANSNGMSGTTDG